MFLTTVLLATAAFAAPLQKRTLSSNDQSLLDLALYLEHLEFALYTGGCNNFTDAEYTAAGFPNGFHDNICLIAQHEAAHIESISSILSANGAIVNKACTYRFPLANPTSFVALANIITSVGIGAYLGGSVLLTDNIILEEVAASILTVEARHDTYLRTGIGASPFPTVLDTGLTATWAFNLAQMFVVSCPTQLLIIQLPKLNLTAPIPSTSPQPATPAGIELGFAWDPSQFLIAVDPALPLYIAIVNQNVSAPYFQPLTRTGSTTGTATAPNNVTGAAYACLTTFAGGLTLADLTSYGTLAGPVGIMLS